MTLGKAAAPGQSEARHRIQGSWEIFSHLYYLDQRSDVPEQYRAIGWVGGRLYSLIYEMRNDSEGEYYRLVTLWKSTRQERELYEEHS